MKWTMDIEPMSAKRPKAPSKRGEYRKVYSDPAYRAWRKRADTWIDEWLQTTNFQILREIVGTGHKTIRDDKGKIPLDFMGLEMRLKFVIPRPKTSTRMFPIDNKTADIDNYTKAVVDAYFEHDAFKIDAQLNDRFIQHLDTMKRYAMPDEKPHIEIELKKI